jgi:hypothetical protein
LPDQPAGTFDEGSGITGAEMCPDVEFDDAGIPRQVLHRWRDYELPNCMLLSANTQSEVGSAPRFSRELFVQTVHRTTNPSRAIVRRAVWYLNGPRNPALYPRSIEREVQQRYTKRGIGPAEPAYPTLTATHKKTRGYASINLGPSHCAIIEAPGACGPEWSRNVALEYRAEWGGIPDEEAREAIGEIVGFITGRRLIQVGETGFDANGHPVEEISINPWGDNTVALCGNGDRPPVPLGPLDGPRQLESVMALLVPAYLSLRPNLGLKSALWQYWLARETTADAGLTRISAAVDGLATRWLKSARAKTRGVYLPKEEYDSLTHSDFATIRQKLALVADRDSIIRILEGAFDIRGVAEKRTQFLRELGLQIGATELAAFKARHAPAPGTGPVSREAFRGTIRAIDAYRCTFERILLKLLGYVGDYIDYTAEGHLATPLDQPVAGDLT